MGSSMSLGHNTGSAQELMAFVERRERLEGDIKDLRDDIKVVNAEIAAAGFIPKAVSAVLKIRKAKPHDYQEGQAILETYLHALGMSTEPPLQRFMSNAKVDRTSLEAVMTYMDPAVPPTGEGHIDIVFGKKTYRLTRDLAGGVHQEEVVAAKPKRTPDVESFAKTYEKPDVPDVDELGAELLGRDYALQNRPVIDNPFPYGDKRRARFDEGWRKATGGDGMGPKDPDDHGGDE